MSVVYQTQALCACGLCFVCRRRKGTERKGGSLERSSPRIFEINVIVLKCLIPGVKRRKLLLADNAGKGTRKRVHPGRTRFSANATRSVERSQVVEILNFLCRMLLKNQIDVGLGPVKRMPRRRRKRKNPSGLTCLILFRCARISAIGNPNCSYEFN